MFWIKLQYILFGFGIILCCIGELVILYTIWTMNQDEQIEKELNHKSIKNIEKITKRRIKLNNRNIFKRR